MGPEDLGLVLRRSVPDGKPPHPDGATAYRRDCAEVEIITTQTDGLHDQVGEIRVLQPFLPDPDDGRARRPGERHQGVEVRIESHDRPPVDPRLMKNRDIRGRCEADVTRVNGVEAPIGEKSRGRAR